MNDANVQLTEKRTTSAVLEAIASVPKFYHPVAEYFAISKGIPLRAGSRKTPTKKRRTGASGKDRVEEIRTTREGRDEGETQAREERIALHIREP